MKYTWDLKFQVRNQKNMIFLQIPKSKFSLRKVRDDIFWIRSSTFKAHKQKNKQTMRHF